jgi:hypothetical protein
MSTLEEQLEIAQKLLRVAQSAEADNLRIEKRYIRYELVVTPLARRCGVRFHDSQGLRKWKQQKFASARHPPSHNCTPQCPFAHVQSGTPIQDPRTGQTCRATGLVFVCQNTLNTHYCGKDVCKQSVVQQQGILACPISGLELGQQFTHQFGIVWDYGTRGKRRPLGKDDKQPLAIAKSLIEEGADDEDGGGGGAGDEVVAEEEEEGTERGSGGGGQGSFLHKRRKQVEPLDLQQKPPTLMDQFMRSKNELNLGKPLYVFFRNSHADEMRQQTQRLDICYGRELIEWVMHNADRRDHKTAEQLVNAILFHPTAKQLFEKLQMEAIQHAEQQCTQYMQHCARYRMKVDWLVMWNLFQQHVVTPYLVPSVVQYLSKQRGVDIAVREYFSLALWKVWKIVECSPYCCADHLDFGDATAKKKRSHIHLKHIAVAILYAMKNGVRKDIWFNKRTRLVYMMESEALKQNPREDLACEEVQFVHPHVYLVRRLPPEDRFQNLCFDHIGGTGVVATAVVETYRWLTRCYDSLLALNPPLTIEQVREYQLSHFSPWTDEDLQGRFRLGGI